MCIAVSRQHIGTKIAKQETTKKEEGSYFLRLTANEPKAIATKTTAMTTRITPENSGIVGEGPGD